MRLTIGRRRTQEVASVEEASQVYSETRDASGEGASTFPDGRIRDGKTVYRISYNGKVWTNEKDDNHRTLVFNPYAEAQ